MNDVIDAPGTSVGTLDREALSLDQLRRLVRQARLVAEGDMSLDQLEATSTGPAPTDDRLRVFGASGGAGETYVAAALAKAGCPAVAAGHFWPASGPVIMTARPTTVSLKATQQFLGRLAHQDAAAARLVGVVMTAATPGRTAKGLAQQVAVTAGGVPGGMVWHIDWQPGWPATPPELLDISRTLARDLSPVVAAVQAATDEPEMEGTQQ